MVGLHRKLHFDSIMVLVFVLTYSLEAVRETATISDCRRSVFQQQLPSSEEHKWWKLFQYIESFRKPSICNYWTISLVSSTSRSFDYYVCSYRDGNTIPPPSCPMSLHSDEFSIIGLSEYRSFSQGKLFSTHTFCGSYIGYMTSHSRLANQPAISKQLLQ